MFGLGFGEIVIVLAIVLLFFGGKKLPELGKALGKSMNNFKKGLKETEEGTTIKLTLLKQTFNKIFLRLKSTHYFFHNRFFLINF